MCVAKAKNVQKLGFNCWRSSIRADLMEKDKTILTFVQVCLSSIFTSSVLRLFFQIFSTRMSAKTWAMWSMSQSLSWVKHIRSICEIFPLNRFHKSTFQEKSKKTGELLTPPPPKKKTPSVNTSSGESNSSVVMGTSGGWYVTEGLRHVTPESYCQLSFVG